MGKDEDALNKTDLKPAPGAFSAVLFMAYKGDCDCQVCKILRDEVEKSIEPYKSDKVGARAKRGDK